MTFNPDRQRRSPRLKDYDYSQNGAYFVTICAQHHECLFGHIVDGDIHLNDAGQMIALWWTRIPERFEGVERDQFIVMPNHLHGILVIFDGEQKNALDRMMQWFKTMTTNAYIRGVKEYAWESFPGKLWQRSYYDKIIRDERTVGTVRDYILYNPMKWALDENNPATWTESRPNL